MVDFEAKMNLAALKKVDSTISSIVDIANQVAVYKFLSVANKWVSLCFCLYDLILFKVTYKCIYTNVIKCVVAFACLFPLIEI